MESTYFKILKSQILCKILGKRCETGNPFWYHFPKLFKTAKVISRPNNNRNFYTSSHLHFDEIKSSSLVNFSKFRYVYSFVTSQWVKMAKSYISCISGARITSINIRWNFEMRSLFLRSLSQNIAVLTRNFDFHGDVSNPNLCQKGSKLVSHVLIVKERWKSIVKGN